MVSCAHIYCDCEDLLVESVTVSECYFALLSSEMKTVDLVVVSFDGLRGHFEGCLSFEHMEVGLHCIVEWLFLGVDQLD